MDNNLHKINPVHGGNIYQAARFFGVGLEEILDFSASINPLGPPAGVLEAIRNCRSYIVNYPDPECKDLKICLAKEMSLQPENFLVGNGSTPLIYLIPKILKPRKALIIGPAFSEYKNALIQSGAEIDFYFPEEASHFSFSADLINNLTAERNFDLIYLANPGNPTGIVFCPEEIEKFLLSLRKTSTMVVLDEAFIDFCPHLSSHSLITTFPNLLILRSMTKFFALAGLRIGLLVGQPEMISQFKQASEPWAVNALAQMAAVECLRDKSFIQRSLTFHVEERDYFHTELSKLEGIKVYPSQANYFLIKIRKSTLTATALKERLFQEKILIRDCGSFEGLSNLYFRIAIKDRAGNQLLLSHLAKYFL